MSFINPLQHRVAQHNIRRVILCWKHATKFAATTYEYTTRRPNEREFTRWLALSVLIWLYRATWSYTAYLNYESLYIHMVMCLRAWMRVWPIFRLYEFGFIYTATTSHPAPPRSPHIRSQPFPNHHPHNTTHSLSIRSTRASHGISCCCEASAGSFHLVWLYGHPKGPTRQQQRHVLHACTSWDIKEVWLSQHIFFLTNIVSLILARVFDGWKGLAHAIWMTLTHSIRLGATKSVVIKSGKRLSNVCTRQDVFFVHKLFGSKCICGLEWFQIYYKLFKYIQRFKIFICLYKGIFKYFVLITYIYCWNLKKSSK